MSEPAKRPWYLIAVVAVLTIDGLNAFAQVVMRLIGESTDPTALLLWQCAVAASGFIAAVAAWKRIRWAAFATLGHGFVLAGMLVQLPTLIALEGEAATSVRASAAAILAFIIVLAVLVDRGVRAR
jgi:hypothetical protein